MDEIDIFKKEIEVLDLCIAFDIEYDPNLFNNRVVRDRARNFKNRDHMTQKSIYGNYVSRMI